MPNSFSGQIAKPGIQPKVPSKGAQTCQKAMPTFLANQMQKNCFTSQGQVNGYYSELSPAPQKRKSDFLKNVCVCVLNWSGTLCVIIQ